jgi:hypothetical protein
MKMKLLLVLVLGIVAKGKGDDDELDPFDMVNFDHVGMKMTKVLTLYQISLLANK